MWSGEWALKELYPDLYMIVEDKDASVSSLVGVRGEGTMGLSNRILYSLFFISKYIY